MTTQETVKFEGNDILVYKDKNGTIILPGMTIRHKDGDTEEVYLCADRESLGINASNENHPSFNEFERQLYNFSQLDLNEWEVVSEEEK